MNRILLLADVRIRKGAEYCSSDLSWHPAKQERAPRLDSFISFSVAARKKSLVNCVPLLASAVFSPFPIRPRREKKEKKKKEKKGKRVAVCRLRVRALIAARDVRMAAAHPENAVPLFPPSIPPPCIFISSPLSTIVEHTCSTHCR